MRWTNKITKFLKEMNISFEMERNRDLHSAVDMNVMKKRSWFPPIWLTNFTITLDLSPTLKQK